MKQKANTYISVASYNISIAVGLHYVLCQQLDWLFVYFGMLEDVWVANI